MRSPCFSSMTECVFKSTGHSEEHAKNLALVLGQCATRMGFPVHRVTLSRGLNNTCTISLLVLCSHGQDYEPLHSLFLLTVGVPQFVKVTPETPDSTTIVRECASLDAISQSLQALSVIADRMKLTMTSNVVGLVVVCTFTRGDMVMNHWVEVLKALI